MEKNGYWEWLQNVLVAHLVCPVKPIEIEGPVRAFASRKDVLLSLQELTKVFGRPGAEHFKSWFYVKDKGKPGSGLSHMVLHSDFEVHDAVYDCLERESLLELVEVPDFKTHTMATFAKGVRARRAYQQAGQQLDPETLGEAYPILLQRERMNAMRLALVE